MKRGIIAFAVGSLVFAAVYASAASLTVSNSVLQTGVGNTGTCDDAVTATYNFGWNTTTGEYDVITVNVVGINTTACSASLVLEVDLANAAGTSLSHVSTTVGAGDRTINVPDASAANVNKTQIAIHS
jgi:hypothetical protein